MYEKANYISGSIGVTPNKRGDPGLYVHTITPKPFALKI